MLIKSVGAGLLLLASNAFGQAKPGATIQLPPSTRPKMTIPGLSNANIVSVSETKAKSDPYPTRVYRHSFRGNFAAVIRGFQEKLHAKDGWKFSWVSAYEGDFWRDLTKGPVAMQGVLVFAARLQRDYKSPTGWSPALPNLSRGWVWVSYDEVVRKEERGKRK